MRASVSRGDPKNAMSDGDLEQKFTAMASKFMDSKQIESIIQSIYRIDTLEDVSDLTNQIILKIQDMGCSGRCSILSITKRHDEDELRSKRLPNEDCSGDNFNLFFFRSITDHDFGAGKCVISKML